MRTFAFVLLILATASCLPIDAEVATFHAGMKEARLHSCPVEESVCSDITAANHCSPALVSGGVLADTETTEHNDGHHQCLLRCMENEHCPEGYRCVDRQHGGNTQLCVRETLCRGNAHCTNPFYGLGILDSQCDPAPFPVCRDRLGTNCESDADCSSLHPDATCYLSRCEFSGDLDGNGNTCAREQLYTGRCKPRERRELGDIFQQIEQEGHGMNDCQELGTSCRPTGGGQGACVSAYGNGLRCHPIASEDVGCPGGFADVRLESEGLEGYSVCIPKIPCRSTTLAIANQTGQRHTQLDCFLTGTECTGRSNLCVDQVTLSCSDDGDCREDFNCYLGVCVARERSGACDDTTNVERTWVHTCEVPNVDM